MIKEALTIDYLYEGTKKLDLKKQYQLVGYDDFYFLKNLLTLFTDVDFQFCFYNPSMIKVPDNDVTSNECIMNIFINDYRLEYYYDISNNHNILTAYKNGSIIRGSNNYQEPLLCNYNNIIELGDQFNIIKNITFTRSIVKTTMNGILRYWNGKHIESIYKVITKLIPLLFNHIEKVDYNSVYVKGYEMSISSQGTGFISTINILAGMCVAIIQDSTLLIENNPFLHPILFGALFNEMWGNKIIHKLLNEDYDKGQIIMIDYHDETYNVLQNRSIQN